MSATQPTLYGTDPAAFMSAFVAEMERGGYVAKADTPERLWTLKDCAQFLGVSESKAREWAHDGMPHIVTNPGAEREHLRFHPAAVSEWAKARSLNK